jgi:Raf kinase inhibitor-like YbhB/YbcL family protein
MTNASTTQTRTRLAISSSAFQHDAPIPTEFTCDGADESPPLAWSGAPDKTVSYALLVEDPDAPGGTYIHWVLYDLPATTHELPRGASPSGAKQGKNSFGKTGYGGPCPPKGKPHHYHFILIALDKSLGLPPGASHAQVVEAMRGHELARGELVGTYARRGSS